MDTIRLLLEHGGGYEKDAEGRNVLEFARERYEFDPNDQRLQILELCEQALSSGP